MAKSRKLDGVSESNVVEMCNLYGQSLAAQALEVSQASLSFYLKRNGYVARTIWRKVLSDSEKDAVDIALLEEAIEAGELS